MTPILTNPVSVVTRLIDTCYDAKAGLRTAAENMSDSAMRNELMEYSIQHEAFAADLEIALLELGEISQTHGSLRGALNRGWMHIIKFITDSEQAILTACHRAESSAIKVYRHAMVVPLPATAMGLVYGQYKTVLHIHDRLHTLVSCGQWN